MDEREIRLRCIEAAVKAPLGPRANGPVDTITEAAESWYAWVVGSIQQPSGQADKPRDVLKMPFKK